MAVCNLGSIENFKLCVAHLTEEFSNEWLIFLMIVCTAIIIAEHYNIGPSRIMFGKRKENEKEINYSILLTIGLIILAAITIYLAFVSENSRGAFYDVGNRLWPSNPSWGIVILIVLIGLIFLLLINFLIKRTRNEEQK
jgi:uncharacterized membrane protein YbhN (UPF0104 family)